MLQKLLFLFFLSMVPIIELRGAIPIGVAWGIPPWLNYAVCVMGNILPVPVLVLFARKVLYWLAGVDKIGPVFQRIIDVGNRKAGSLGRYEMLGLFCFVAIPLPGTGAWTGSLIATLLQMKVGKATAVIGLGVLSAGIIMWLASTGLFGFLGVFA